MDILSFSRMAVIEDKSKANSVADKSIEAQLIAEAIAIYQSDQKIFSSDEKCFEDTKLYDNENIVFGVKVKGTDITFYIIPITNSILTAVATCTATFEKTFVSTFGPFDFQDEKGRSDIIKFFDNYRVHAVAFGEKKARRNSASIK
jgi:hypothetical protein